VRFVIATLWALVGGGKEDLGVMKRHIQAGDSLLGSIGPKRNKKRTSESPSEYEALTLMGQEIGFHRPLIWADAFPDVFGPEMVQVDNGFEVVLTNPPWGRIRPNFKEFFASLNDELGHYQGSQLRQHALSSSARDNVAAKEMWSEYSSRVKNYARALARSPDYEWQKVRVNGRSSGGDPDLFKYFMERSFKLTASGSEIGVIIPSSFRNTQGCTGIRQMLAESGEVFFLDEVTNKRKHFPIHSMFRFSLLGFRRCTHPKIFMRNVAFGRDDVSRLGEEDAMERSVAKETVKISRKYLRTVGGDYTIIPEVRNEAEKALLYKLHKAHPMLGEGPNQPWQIRFSREVDMTNDSASFVRREAKIDDNLSAVTAPDQETELFPVIEGKMINQFDYAAKGYRAGQARRARWDVLPLGKKEILPHYLLPISESHIKYASYLQPRACFCDVTGHANRRTVLAAIVPGRVVCGNKVPTIRFDPLNDPRLHLIWIAIANSLVIDWIVRRKISTTLNFFFWESVPFPRVTAESSEGRGLAKLAAELTDIGTGDDPLLDWLRTAADYKRQEPSLRQNYEHRFKLQTQIDNIVGELFNLEQDEFDLIRQDFPLIEWPATVDSEFDTEREGGSANIGLAPAHAR